LSCQTIFPNNDLLTCPDPNKQVHSMARLSGDACSTEHILQCSLTNRRQSRIHLNAL
jgi:hypothetical protein